MDDQLHAYLMQTRGTNKTWVARLEKYAADNQVPIMEPLAVDFLMQLIRIKKPKRILEIGTAIGYSALQMVEAYENTSIVTIERDEIRYKEAINNINELNKQNQITVLFGDALNLSEQVKAMGPFDLLFIDAAKGQYQHFFDMYTKFLTDDALIVSDNVLFKGLVFDESTDNKRLKKIAAKVRQYNDWLVDHPSYKTTIVPIGDGVAISVKEKDKSEES
ncbi:O-methyltransferase [Aquibacillus salsiterrae]|uniref:tRNA 5-hydroxyuridine methyltransferase n=1 Tax=Aquibacillus salsiterrae TaxID=2950439 RepID=A0A9X3WAJ0_9BACI|nr:O-methyltransferase [Aquibacillus salsiterrae]MDC3415610.1 O-methyltransferase [Aquibacillus salsiterrae]